MTDRPAVKTAAIARGEVVAHPCGDPVGFLIVDVDEHPSVIAVDLTHLLVWRWWRSDDGIRVEQRRRTSDVEDEGEWEAMAITRHPPPTAIATYLRGAE